MIQNALFVDTWGWLAIANREEPGHEATLQYYRDYRRRNVRIYTSDYVFAEFITLLFARVIYSRAVDFMQDLLATASADCHT